MSDTADLRDLEPLVGVWKTTIEMLDEAGKSTTHHATDTYRWALGKKFIFHDVDGMMAGQKVETLEIISPGPRGAFACRSYDNSGSVDDFKARLTRNRWTIKGKTLKFDGRLSRDRQTLSGEWKQKCGDVWQVWLKIILRKTEEEKS